MRNNVAKFLAVASLVSCAAFAVACNPTTDDTPPAGDTGIPYDKTVLQTMETGVTSFDGVANGQVAMPFGIYGKNSDPTVQNGKVVLSGAQADSLVLSLGNTTRGRWELTFDAEVTGYEALAKIVYDVDVDADGAIQWLPTSYANLYKDEGVSVSEIAKVSGTTHKITFTFGQAFTNFGFVLFNTQETEGSIKLDNISFKKVDYTTKYTMDMEGMKLDFVPTSGGWAQQPFLKQSASVHLVSASVNTNEEGTLQNCGVVIETEGGNSYLKATMGADTNVTTFENPITRYFRVSVAWLEAGTYTITMKVKATGTNVNGGLILTTCNAHAEYPDTNLDGAVHDKRDVEFTADWTEYTYEITLETAKYIQLGIQRGTGNPLDATVCLDDITVLKTA